MANLLEQMLVPAQPIQAQAPQSPQAQSAPHPQDSSAAKNIINGVAQAASIAGAFIPPVAPVAAGLQGANVAANFL